MLTGLRDRFRVLFGLGLLLSLLALAGCGAGGDEIAGGLVSGAFDDGGPAPAPAPPEVPPGPIDEIPPEIPETVANYGLDAINAEAAYAAGATGGGVIVAVIDTGIDVDHPDLEANISPLSIDIVSGDTDTLNDGAGHGTQVSGIIAAIADGAGIQGVAFEATVLAIRTDIFDAGQCPSTACEFDQADVAEAVDYAVANGADIINLSLGQFNFPAGADGDDYIAALQAAVDAGVIIVAASGNDRLTAPGFPALAAGLTATDGQPTEDEPFDAKGLILAVGAVDEDLEDSGFHNLAARTEDFFVVAPGVDIVSTSLGGGFDTVSGTSFAAPHVAGAAALLIDLFPTTSAEDIVQILLLTATDLGLDGPDQFFGMGLINLEAAVLSIGPLSIPLGTTLDGATEDLLRTQMSLGSAFGDALAETAFLGEAIVLDSFLRPYKFDLRQNITSAPNTFNLSAFVDSEGIRQLEMPAPEGASLVLGYYEPKTELTTSGRTLDGLANEAGFGRLSLAGALTEGLSGRFGYNETSASQLSFDPGANQNRGLFWGSDEIMNPQFQLVGRGSGAGLSRYLGESTTLSLGWFEADSDGDIDLSGDFGRASLAQLHLGHVFESGASLGFGFSYLDERDAYLNSQASGAFDFAGGSTSQFYTVAGTLPLWDWHSLELLGAYTMGTTSMPAATGDLLGNWSTVGSNAFGVGIVARDMISDGDRLGLLVGQPLRVSSAHATLTLGTEVDAEGNIAQQSQRVDVTPEGREIDLQLAYQRPLAPGMSLSSWIMVQRQPGHNADAGPALGGGVRFVFKF